MSESVNMDDWELCQKEWDNEADYEKLNNGFGECICGEHITNLYTIKNIKNNNELVLGSVCINTTFEGCTKLLESVNMWECPTCLVTIRKTSRHSHEESQHHTKMLEMKINYRECNTCDEWVISISEPKWKKTCYDCFMKGKGLRKCPSCDKYKKIQKQYSHCYKCNTDMRMNSIKNVLSEYCFDD